MIPKKIHYCWFGRNEKSKLVKKCIESWEMYCPDYEIIEWNEDNFDISQHPYLQWCYKEKKWAFLSDFARLLILKKYGGIYLDTDVEVIRSLDDLLKYHAFFGFENDEYINTGQGFGCIPEHPAVLAMIKPYKHLVSDQNVTFTMMTCPKLNTEALLPYGLERNGKHQQVCDAEILPPDYMNPYDDPTGILHKTENTYSIHWYGKSWMNKNTIIRSRLMKFMHRIFGTDFFVFRMLRKHE